MMTPEPYGQLLRDARIAAALTQEALAVRAGVSVRAIQALERGRNTPHRDTARRLAAALGLDIGEGERFAAAAPRRRAAAPQEPAIPPTNVPLAMTSFVGRAREIVEVTGVLGGTPLLTLVGTGGVGKTRLAVQVAGTLRMHYPHGVWLVELAHVTDPALVPQAVAAALPMCPPGDPTPALVTALQDRHVLLILDTCEHMLDACAQLASTLLATCPRVRILATSREPLMIAGEALWHVPPLALPEGGRRADLDALRRSEAVRLFVERAAALQPSFALTPANAPAVADICRRLDGIPLALELAAARVRSLGVEQLVTRLDDRFRLLTAGYRTALPRQQTLRAMVDWSYDLLPEQERRLFERLSVFAGGFTAEAAEVVSAGEERAADGVLDLLARLVDKSLIVVDEGDAVGYRLLDTLRQYGWERLCERGDGQALRARHAAYYVDVAERAEPELFKAAQAAWHNKLDAALDNIRSALGWYLDQAESGRDGATPAAESAVRLAGALWWFWLVRTHRWEGMAWLERALRQQTVPSPGRAKAFLGLGHLVCRASTPGSQARGQALLEEGIAVARAVGDRATLVFLLSCYGGHRRGAHGQEHDQVRDATDDAQGADLLREGLALARDSGEPALVAHALRWHAYSSDIGSDVERGHARAEARESLALAAQVGDHLGTATAQRVLGRIARHEGDLAQARVAFSAELAIMRTIDDRAGIALALSNLGEVAQAAGDLTGALESYEQSLAEYRGIDYDQDLMARVLRHLGDLALAQGDTASAERRYAESLTTAQRATSQG